MSAPENPSAFPFVIEANGLRRYASGMTLRDYFAAQALAGCMARDNGAVITACALYQIADAMLAERAKGGES